MSLVNCLSDPVRSCSRFAVLIFMLSFVDRFLLMTISPSGRAFPTALEDSIIQTVMTVIHDTVRVRHQLWNSRSHRILFPVAGLLVAALHVSFRPMEPFPPTVLASGMPMLQWLYQHR